MTHARARIQERVRLALEGLQPLAFLSGRWEGRGEDHGVPVHARCLGRHIIDGSWMELIDQVLDEEGNVTWEDRTLYRYDPTEEGIRVIHLLPVGDRKEYPVRLLEPGIAWVTGPAGPRVELVPSGEGWTSRVTLPGRRAPDIVLQYQPHGARGQDAP